MEVKFRIGEECYIATEQVIRVGVVCEVVKHIYDPEWSYLVKLGQYGEGNAEMQYLKQSVLFKANELTLVAEKPVEPTETGATEEVQKQATPLNP